MKKLTEDQLYLNSILLGVMMNFTPYCGEKRAKETHNFLQEVFTKLSKYENGEELK